MKTTEPIRDKQQVQELTRYFLKLGQIRNYVLVIISIFTALRISDLLSITCNDVYDFENHRVRRKLTLTEQKTGKTKTIALNKCIIAALSVYFPQARSGEPLILNKQTGKSLSRTQAYRLIRAAGDALNFTERISPHSLRKTFGYHSWKNGVPPVVIMEIYNHSSLAVTQRYLGVTQDDKNAAYLELNFDITAQNKKPHKHD